MALFKKNKEESEKKEPEVEELDLSEVIEDQPEENRE